MLADLARAADAANDVIAGIEHAGGTAYFVEVDVRDAAATAPRWIVPPN